MPLALAACPIPWSGNPATYTVTYHDTGADGGAVPVWTTGEDAVGNVGPGGGLVFYDEADGVNDIVGVRYLEAAPPETEWVDRVWGGYDRLAG